jgi:hypothetical protein
MTFNKNNEENEVIKNKGALRYTRRPSKVAMAVEYSRSVGGVYIEMDVSAYE